MRAIGFNYRFIYFFILFFVFIFWITPSLAFAQTYQIPSDYGQKQAQDAQSAVDKLIQSQYQRYNVPTPAPTSTSNQYSAYAAGYTPHNDTDSQLLNLLKNVTGSKSVTLSMLLLIFLLGFPDPFHLFSVQTRLNIYKFITTHFPFLSLAIPIPILIPVVFFGSLGVLLILGICIYTVYKIIRSLILPILIYLIALLLKKTGVKFNKNGYGKIFLELTFPSDTSKSAYATEQLYILLHTLAGQKNALENLLGLKKSFSLELVSDKDQGIRYILATPAKYVNAIQRSLLSYLPGIKIKEVDDYLEENISKAGYRYGVTELKLASHFALPLSKQKTLDEHDPISYLTGNMTKLSKNELISFQIITTPVLASSHKDIVGRMNDLRLRMYRGEPLTPALNEGILTKISTLPVISIFVLLIKLIFLIFKGILVFAWSIIDPNSKTTTQVAKSIKAQEILNPYEQELSTTVKEKINQKLFETSIRMLVISKDSEEFQSRVSGLMAFLGVTGTAYQTITTKGSFLPGSIVTKQRLSQFRERILSPDSVFNQNPILSTAEISDLYHFPYTDITKTEGLMKSRSRELPAPLSLKKGSTKFDVLVGVNQYGGELSPIGLTLEQRQKHMYVIGKTGTGKTTILTSSIYQDMLNGKGLAVFDPHGDMFQELLAIIPENRKKDVVVFDPSDRDFPLGLNLLSPSIKFHNKEDEHDWITSSVLAVFKKLADEKYWGPRMEHILRNTTLTALLTPNPTLFTLQRLLTDKQYQKKIAVTLKDPVLKQFWQKEFALMGSMQLSSVTAPLTQRLGSFISSKMSRHILLQEQTTISIQKIMDEGKILLINLSKGDLGEDQSFFFGTILTSLIWMAAYQRTKIPESQRRDFFVYIDEFQNFATPQFAEITSEGRKFHVSLITSHQNIAQIKDPNILKIVAGNAHIIICTKASPDDEQFILPFMDPEVKKGDIVNLAPFNFFMKVTTDESEDAFSGKTVPVDVKKSEKTKDKVIDYTRTHYATPRSQVERYLEKLFAEDTPKSKKTKKIEKPNKNNKNPHKKKVKQRKAHYV